MSTPEYTSHEECCESSGRPDSRATDVANLYVQSWKSHLNRTKQLVQEPPFVGDAQAEKLGPSFAGDDEGTNGPASTGDVKDDADASPSSV